MAELYGIEHLRKKLAQKRSRVNLRYDYYEMKNYVPDFGISTPPQLRAWQSSLGWCTKAVDSIASRLNFYEFKNDNFDFNTIFNMNNPDVLFDSAILGALIGSCSFIYISQAEDGYPRLQVIDGANATGIIDPFTNMLTEGYAVLERDQNGNATLEAYFVTGRTDFVSKEAALSIPNAAPYPLLVPIIFRPDAKRPFGHSRISRACMSLMGSAIRTIKRSEISAEFYSFPQRYATGISEEYEDFDKWKSAISAMLMFEKDSDGDKPVVGQFAQQSMSPHVEQLRMFASMFGGETGLTLDDLGFPGDNPSSAESIKATHENLRLECRKAQKTFGSGFLNAGYLASCLRDNYPYKRRQAYLTRPVWDPIFEPDASMLSGLGDGILKINQAVPEYVNEDSMRELTGIRKSDDNG